MTMAASKFQRWPSRGGHHRRSLVAAVVAALAFPFSPPVSAIALLANGGFENGNLTGWTVSNLERVGMEYPWYLSNWYVASTPATPLTGNSTVGAASGNFYAVTDEIGPSTLALSQMFTVPQGVNSVNLSFNMFVNDQYGVGPLVDPSGLDHFSTGPNQHARVDLLTANASPFSTGADVLKTFYLGLDSAPKPNPYTAYWFDLMPWVVPGGSYQIRFANVAKQQTLNQGVDNVSIEALISNVIDIGDKGRALFASGNTISDTIIGSGGVIIVGPGSLTLTANNTYSGGTNTIYGTTLQLGDGGTTGSILGDVYLSFSSNLVFNRADTVIFDGKLQGEAFRYSNGGRLVQAGSGSVILTNSIDIGVVAINPGATLQLGNGGKGGGSYNFNTVDNGSLVFNRADDVGFGYFREGINVSTGVISGTGSLTQAGTGRLTLNVDNTYTGGTIINPGASLQLGNGSVTGGIVGNVVDNGNLTFKRLNNVVFDGLISGTGSLDQAGVGLLTLTGNNTYTGGTTIAPGATLQLGNGGTTGGVVGDVANDGSLIVNRADPLVLAGAITGAGRLIQVGSGNLNLNGNSRLADGVVVGNGSLSVNGHLQAQVDVNPGGTLGGTGQIGGAVHVSGTLAPGNSPGTLSVTGPVVMNQGSRLQAEIDGKGTGNGAGNFDRLLVTGSFTAAGTLAPVLRGIGADASNSFVPALGDKFRIVSAQGGILGRFDNVQQPTTGLASGTRLEAFYNADGSNSIDLFATPESYAKHIALYAGNDNAQSVGKVLDGLRGLDNAHAATASQNQLRYVVAGLTATQLPKFATILAGEVHGAMAAAAPEAGRWLQNALVRQLGTSSSAAEPAGLEAGDGLWLDFNAAQGRTDSGTLASGYSASRYQFAIGVDLLRSQANRLGLGVSYASTSIGPASGSGSLEETAPFLYGQYAIGKTQPVVLDALFAYGFSTWQTERADPLRRSTTLKTNTSGHSTALSLGMRSPFALGGGISIEPYTRVLWQGNSRGAVDEGSSTPVALGLASYGQNGTRWLIGVAISPDHSDPLNTAFTYRASIAFGEDFGDLLYPTVQASLAGASLAINAPKIGREFAQLNLSATYHVMDSAYLYAGLNGEARENRLDGGVNAGFNVRF